MSTNESTGVPSSRLYDARRAEQCLSNNLRSLQSTRGSLSRSAVQDTKAKAEAFKSMLTCLQTWKDQHKISWKKGKREIPDSGAGSDGVTLDFHADYRDKAAAFKSAVKSHDLTLLGESSTPIWNGCKCVPVDMSSMSALDSQSTGISAPLYIDDEEREKETKTTLPESWDDEISD